MNPTASTVGGYLRDLPPDRRVAMARLCSMIRRSARGVRESMRYGLSFYELDGPLFALESGRRHMSLYVSEKEVVLKHKDALTGVNAAKTFIKFSDLNRLPLDVVEKIVRDSVAARRQRLSQGTSCGVFCQKLSDRGVRRWAPTGHLSGWRSLPSQLSALLPPPSLRLRSVQAPAANSPETSDPQGVSSRR